MNKVKVGVIGCGYWGPKLIRNFNDLESADLRFVADLRTDRLQEMHSLYPQVETSRDYRELLRSEVDAVVIATPVSTHYALAMECLRQGKHILVEKPLAGTVGQAEEIAGFAERQGLVAMVGHTFQYNRAVAAMRDVIRSGELGDVYYISATRVNLGLLQPDINVLWDLAPHDLSILLHVLDAKPARVSAHGAYYIQLQRKIHEVAYVTVIFENGVIANLRLSWLDPVKMRSITVVGSHKMLVYDDISDDKVRVFDKGVDVPPYSNTVEEFHMSYRHGSERVVPIDWVEPLRLQSSAFVDWIRGGPPASSNATFGARVVRVLEAAQWSLMNGGQEAATGL